MKRNQSEKKLIKNIKVKRTEFHRRKKLKKGPNYCAVFLLYGYKYCCSKIKDFVKLAPTLNRKDY